MPTASFALTALVATLILGGALSAWLWWVRCPRLVAAAGIRTLAAMRWREFSRFVIEALQAQGFEATRLEPGQHRQPEADLRLTREDQTWLLNCRQGANSRVTRAMVAELARTVRIASADGGILATLGRIDPDARRQSHGIELLDGATLWPLIDPLLPPSLHRELSAKARAETLRSIGLAWLLALAFGVLSAMLVGTWLGGAPSAGAAAPGVSASTDGRAAPPTPAAPAPPEASSPSAPAPLSEEEMRKVVVDEVGMLPGVESTSWATRSTLLVQLLHDADPPLIDAICQVLERHVPLRASRLQLQPPAGSSTPVRFMQCQRY